METAIAINRWVFSAYRYFSIYEKYERNPRKNEKKKKKKNDHPFVLVLRARSKVRARNYVRVRATLGSTRGHVCI